MDKLRKFGTAPVFFTAISTILGAVLFLRFGFAVGMVGFLGTLAIILIGHSVTIPTAMAIAEIATNQRVEGGGEYFIISRSFGLVIGATIGLALYLSQAISVAFYVIAFTEAFQPFFQWLSQRFELPHWLSWLLLQKQTVGVPALLVLTYIMLTRGADLGVKALYVVVATLALSLAAFFLGTTEYERIHPFDPMATVADLWVPPQEGEVQSPATSSANNPVQIVQADTSSQSQIPPIAPLDFFTVFAIIFPAFTGMTAGVGLSGDLRDPGKSIPMGTLAATLTGMVVYVLIAWKLAAAAPPEQLADTSQLVMAQIAWQGKWLIPLGLAAATISSALGSIMVAPRTLQAIARDRVIPMRALNVWLSRGKGPNDEPFNASVVTLLIAGAFVLMGGLDAVAQIISMFFMVTYGSLCLISFLQHFAADPSYRPRFRSRWYLSLFGAVACFGLMFFMNAAYALVALVLMIGLYALLVAYNPDKRTLAVIFQGVIFQLSRQLQVYLQKAKKERTGSWRPSVIAISEDSFKRLSTFDLLRWISQKYGFGTYIHLIKGYLSKSNHQQATVVKERLIRIAEASKSNVYVDTMISPSYTSSIAQAIQLPGVAGTENNFILLEYSKLHPEKLDHILDNIKLVKAVDFDLGILCTSERGFGLKRQIHVWITPMDFENAILMILLSYILLGHSEWSEAEIKIFALFPRVTLKEEKEQLMALIEEGQLPISPHNVRVLVRDEDRDMRQIVCAYSQDADLVCLGFRDEAVKRLGAEVFKGYEEVGNILFVNAGRQKSIK